MSPEEIEKHARASANQAQFIHATGFHPETAAHWLRKLGITYPDALSKPKARTQGVPCPKPVSKRRGE